MTRQQQLRAILVSVDYDDLLSLTLPYNRHHFAELMVVTTPQDQATQRLAQQYDAQLHLTEAFYHRGASFNKWLALEEALDVYGRHGLLCLMDADVLWPRQLPDYEYRWNYLHGPLRYMWTQPAEFTPPESQWSKYQLHGNQGEWAGYTQIFYADDIHLPAPPWHQTNWLHAGGADSMFQRLWPAAYKLRTPWRVLHLGLAGRNWCGRSTARLGGQPPPTAASRLQQLRGLLAQRRRSRGQADPYAHERYPPAP